MRFSQLLALAAILVGCGGSSTATTQPPGTPGPPSGPPSNAVTVAATPSLSFDPASVTVAVGGTVTYAFGSVAHNVFFDNLGSPDNIPGSNSNVSVPRTFPTAGTYTYSCHIHPSMHGTVVVQ